MHIYQNISTDNILMIHNIYICILINYNDNFINPPSTDT